MTKLLDPLLARPAFQRIPLALVLSIVGLFLLGLVAGVTVASFELGRLPRAWWVLAMAVGALVAGPLLLWTSWRLFAPAQDASRFERRYWKMWLWVVALGIPLGMVLALPLMGDAPDSLGNIISNAPLPPAIAAIAAALAVIMLAAALLLYHRSIDDHEEQAYLWGSHVAFHFVAMAVPAWWLLQRGGWVAPLDTIGALVLLLVSFAVQAAVWAWFKFR